RLNGLASRIGHGSPVAIGVAAITDGIAIAVGHVAEAVLGIIRVGRCSQRIRHGGAVAIGVVSERHCLTGGIADSRQPVVCVIKIGGGLAVGITPADEVAHGIVSELGNPARRIG